MKLKNQLLFLCYRDYKPETGHFLLGCKQHPDLTLYAKVQGKGLFKAWCHWHANEENVSTGKLTGIQVYSDPNDSTHTYVCVDTKVTYGRIKWSGWEKFVRINVEDTDAPPPDDNGAAGER